MSEQFAGTARIEEIARPEHQDDKAFDRLGRIVAVSGGKAVVMLDRNANMPEGQSPEIGTLLKVDRGETVALALVSSMSMPVPDAGEYNEEVRIVEVEFIGEIARDETGRPKSFRRGVSTYPSLGDVVGLANREELKLVYAVDAEAAIRVGVIHQDKSIPAMVKLDEMLGKHFAILGTTGTGKSCSVALILRRILERNPHAHILLLDMHREYASAFSDMAEVVRPEDLNLPFWLLNFEEICEVLIGNHSYAETDTEVLRELIPLARARYRLGNGKSRLNVNARKGTEQREAQNISVDVPLPYRASDLMAIIDEHMGKLELKNQLAPYKRIRARLESLTRDPRYAFMFGSLTVHDSLTEILSRLFRIPVDGRPITVLELGGLPSEIINVVVSVLARMAFDFALYSHGQVPITFVCEEAHRYVPNDKNAGFEPTRRAISRIAKEGRKYGVSLCIITQRPSELDPTILSQCNTIFSLRLSNEKDQEILRAGISDSAASLLDFMPTMGVGEAVAFGEGISLPTRIRIDLLPPEFLPRSTTASFSRRWRQDIDDPRFLQEIVNRWRHQDLEPVQQEETEETPSHASTQPGSHAPQASAPAQAPRPEALDRIGATSATERLQPNAQPVPPGRIASAEHAPQRVTADVHAAARQHSPTITEGPTGAREAPPSVASGQASGNPGGVHPPRRGSQQSPNGERPATTGNGEEAARQALRESLQEVLKRFREK